MASLKEWLLNEQKEPIVLSKKICDWPAMSWTPTKLIDVFGEQKLKFRIGPKYNEGMQMEIIFTGISLLLHFQGNNLNKGNSMAIEMYVMSGTLLWPIHM